MADYKKGTRVLVKAVDDNGKIIQRTWYVATITAVGRNKREGQYQVIYDDGFRETVDLEDILGSTEVKRKRKTAIVGHENVRKWKVQTREQQRVRGSKREAGLTARDMLRVTPSKPFKVNAAYVSITRRQTRKRKEGDFYTQLSKTSTSPSSAGKPPSKHAQRIDILTEGVKNPTEKGARLKVSCTCDNFKFMWEVALSKRGAADIVFSNGEKPVITNPSMVPGLCKHLVRVLEG